MQLKVALKSILACAGLTAVAALALNATRVEQFVLGVAAPLRTRAIPYTVVLQDYRLKPDGTAVPTMKLIIAVRSDGSRAMESVTTVPGNNFAERILTFSSGRKSYIIESSQRKSTTFDPTRHTSSPPWLPDPQNNCLIPGSNVQQKVVGIEDVGGYRTVKLTTSGAITLWLAIEHGCALIKDRAEWNDGEVSEKRLVAFVQGEPSPSLFDDPAGFEEVPPSVIFPGPMPASEDSYYYAHRPVDSPERPQK